MAQRLVFVGNCQAAGLQVAYNQYVVEPTEDRAISIDAQRIGPAERAQIEAADTIVVQVTDQNSAFVDELSGLGTRILKFPYITGYFYWPFATEGHCRYFDSGLSEFAIYADETGGDAFLNRLYKEGKSAEEAVEIYCSLDFEKAHAYGRRLEMIMRTQRGRDERSGVETADYIASNLGKEFLFALRGHPTAGIFLHVARQVFDRLGASPQAIARMERNTVRCPLHDEEVPIHPALLTRLGYPADVVHRKFAITGLQQTFEQYVASYMRCEFDRGVQEGIRFCRQGKFEEGVKALLPRLPERIMAVGTMTQLSIALARIERGKEAIAVAEQACELYPTDAGIQMLLATWQIHWDSSAAVEKSARAVLAMYPDHFDANNVLAMSLEQQGRHAEALNAVRRGRELGSIDVGGALRDAWLSLRAGDLPAAASACADAIRWGATAAHTDPLLAGIAAAQQRDRDAGRGGETVGSRSTAG